ncbi:MAG: TetR/AcrR family transcriptional regulator [Pseudomonadota bacterium]
MTKRLTREDWLRFALIELSRSGHTKLSANALAAKLGVSRGSFYWHFQSLDDFHEMLLKMWADLTTEKVIDDLRAVGSPKQRLASLIKQSMLGDSKLERSIRSWAVSNTTVARHVHAVDARRVAYVEQLLLNLGADPVDVRSRSQILYWAVIGRILSTNGVEPNLSDTDFDRFAELLTK